MASHNHSGSGNHPGLPAGAGKGPTVSIPPPRNDPKPTPNIGGPKVSDPYGRSPAGMPGRKK